MIALNSIRKQIVLGAATCLVIALVAVVTVGINYSSKLENLVHETTHQFADKELSYSLEETSKFHASQIRSELAVAMDSVEAMSSVISGMASSLPPEQRVSREMLSSMTHDLLAGNEKFLGAYIAFEPNAWDGKDSVYEAIDGKGQFNVYWTRSANNELLPSAVDSQRFYLQDRTKIGTRVSEWYLCPVENGRSCLIDPWAYDVQGKKVLMANLVTPIKAHGKTIGMLGIDLSVNFIDELAQELQTKQFGPNSHVSIITQRGVVAGDTGTEANLGGILSDWNIHKTTFNQGRQQWVEIDGYASVITPIKLPNADEVWTLWISVPRSEMMADIDALQLALEKSFDEFLNSQVIAGVLISAIALGLLYVMARQISTPIQQVVDTVTRLSEAGGDLTYRLPVSRKDETGQLMTGINALMASLQSMIQNIAGSVDHLKRAANRSAEIADTSHQGVEQQRSALEQVATAINEMASTAHEVATNVANTATSVEEANQAIGRCGDVVNTSADMIRQLGQEMQTSTQTIGELETQSHQISGILDVIRSISDQTNLLALNAAIEAARAGEHGRGFAVVADEVRQLASKTQSSTEEIQTMIDRFQSQIQLTVETINKGQAFSDNSIESSKKAVVELESLMAATSAIQDMMCQIATAAEEQHQVTEDINRNITEITEITASAAQGAESANSEAQAMLGQTGEVENKLNQFKY